MAVFGAQCSEGVVPVALHGDGLYAVGAAGGEFLGGEMHGVAVVREGCVEVGVADAPLCGEVAVFIEDVDLYMTYVVLEHVCAHSVVVVNETDEESGWAVGTVLLHHGAGSGCHPGKE